MDNDKEFLEYILKLGKIKDVEEAFKEFPPENEWHEGKIGNVVQDNEEEYSKFNIGDIVFVKSYKYKDGTEGRNHLFVIISQNNLAVPIENFCMLISSQIEKAKYDANVDLKKDNLNHLKKDSIVKTDIIYKITDKQILFKVGEVTMDKVEEYRELYKKLN